MQNKTDRTAHTGDHIPEGEIKDYNFIIDGKNFFDQPIKNDLIQVTLPANCNRFK